MAFETTYNFVYRLDKDWKKHGKKKKKKETVNLLA